MVVRYGYARSLAAPAAHLFVAIGRRFITWLYGYFGKDTGRGNNLIMDEIHTPGGGVPARMTPLIFIIAILTHLFDSPAGRERYEQGGTVLHHNVETGCERLLVCLELADEKQKLEAFIAAQKEWLKNKTIIYKAVELWLFNK